MSTLYMTISRLCEQRGISGYRLCRDIGIQPSILTDLKSGRKKGLAAETAQKIADYFGVTVGYLLGNEKEPVQTDEPNDEDIKFALFGGDGEITDEMFDEVKAFAENGGSSFNATFPLFIAYFKTFSNPRFYTEIYKKILKNANMESLLLMKMLIKREAVKPLY